jgi:hypothetical protein
MLQAHPIAPQMARKISIFLFAQKPPNLSAPCDEPCAVVRRRGQGRPSAGARVLALTEASTMADWRRRRQWSCSRIALLLIADVMSLGPPNDPIRAQPAPTPCSER